MEQLKVTKKLSKVIVIVLLLISVHTAYAASTKPASVLLQEGLYAEEVEGNLDEAIKIYQQVITSSEQMEQSAAQATYRIALCYLKKGDKEQAAKQFSILISKYPKQDSVIREAQKQLEKLQPSINVTLDFSPVVELEIPIYDENDNGIKKCFLDFETAKLFSIPENFNIRENKDEFLNWCIQNNLDAVAYLDNQIQLSRVWQEKQNFVEMPNDVWSRFSPEEVQGIYNHYIGDMETRYENLPATFAFKTIEGNLGLLQILSTNTIDKTIKIRYKMLRQEREAFLPDADDVIQQGIVPIILDLSTGKILPGSPNKQYFNQLKEGDIAYFDDEGKEVIGCFRGAKITRKLENGQYSDTPDQSHTDKNINLYIIKIPSEMFITTKDGDTYDLTILSKYSKGLNIKYAKVLPQHLSVTNPSELKEYTLELLSTNNETLYKLEDKKPSGIRNLGWKTSQNRNVSRTDNIMADFQFSADEKTAREYIDLCRNFEGITLLRVSEPDNPIAPFERIPVNTIMSLGLVPYMKSDVTKDKQLELDKLEKPKTMLDSDISWSNNQSTISKTNPDSSVRLLMLLGVQTWEEAITNARNILPELKKSTHEFAGIGGTNQSMFVAVLTSENNLAVVQVDRTHRTKSGTENYCEIHWWLERIPDIDFEQPKTFTIYNLIGPVINYIDRAIDLDNDKLLSIPDEQVQKEHGDNVTWLFKNGGDVFAQFYTEDCGLIGSYMILETLPSRAWDELSSEELIDKMKGRQIDPYAKDIMKWNAEGEQPVYAFATQNGSVGLLQMLSVDKESKKIELRYKKIQGRVLENPLQSKSPKVEFPAVISTEPENYTDNVSPATTEISVTFDREMMDRSWSWVRWNYPFPEGSGNASYDKTKTTCTLSVKMEPGKAYLLRINSDKHSNFKSADGIKAQPFVLVFSTLDKNGKPTPIPAEMLSIAKQINSAAPEKPYTQQFYADIRPDGVLNFKNTITQKNTGDSTLKTISIRNSDIVNVTAMQDDKGRPLKFTTTHSEGHYRYNMTLNDEIVPGQTFSYTHTGTMTGQVKQVAGMENTYSFQMVHYPNAEQATLKIDTFLLPEGAELMWTEPSQMDRGIKDGRIELHNEKIIPVGGNIVTQFQYKLKK